MMNKNSGEASNEMAAYTYGGDNSSTMASEQISPLKEEISCLLVKEELPEPTVEDGMSEPSEIKFYHSEQSIYKGVSHPSIKEESPEPVVKMEYEASINCGTLEMTVEEDNFGLIFEDELPKPMVEDGISEPNEIMFYNSEQSIYKEVFDASIKKESSEPGVKTEYEESINCGTLEMTVEEDNFGLIFKDEFSEPSVKETHCEISAEGISGSEVMQGTVINSIDAKLGEWPGNTAPLSDVFDVIRIENGVWSVTSLPKGIEFGPYPCTSTASVGVPTEAVRWTGSMRESCEKEQHNIEAVRRGGQVYYRTTTAIQPRTELVISTMNDCKETNVSEKDKPYMKWPLKSRALKLTGEKPHQCTICGKKLCSMNYLKKHELMHTAGKPHKPYECTECGKRFLHMSSLRKHLQRHTGLTSHRYVMKYLQQSRVSKDIH